MAVNIPLSHQAENEKLTADGYVELYEIQLQNGTVLTLKANNTVKWQGVSWQGLPLKFDGYSSASGEQLARPTMILANPEGSFSTFIRDGLLTRATMKRYLVLYEDILADKNIFQVRQWVIWSTPQLTRDGIQLELRNSMDGVNFDVPARMYIPPEFPSVQLR